MDESRKLVIAALVVMLGGNAGNIINAVNPRDDRPDQFTGIDGQLLRADLLRIYNTHLIEQQRELEKIRQRLNKCEYRLSRCEVK